MKAVVFTLGCKVNQYESQSLLTKLMQLGYQTSTELEYADLYVINTCSVTAEADKKSRQAISRVLKFNENARVIVLGCSAQNNPSQYLSKPRVLSVAGTGSKTDALERILTKDIYEHSFKLADIYERDCVGDNVDRTRALIKIQDGCNRFCSYCIVPYLRGRSRSKPLDDIVIEAQKNASISLEIVLTGIDISSYGQNINQSLSSLIEALKAVKTRKRLGSLECGVIDRPFLEAMRESNFCDHFHLSLQSGSDSVLKRMNRKYAASEYLEKVKLIREYFPLAGITTDVICGFCGETDDEHAQTIDFIKKVQFSDIHVFPFSPRVGTRAYSMPRVADQTKAQRAHELNELKKQLRHEFFIKNIGQTAQVYVEQSQNGHNFGFTSNYIKVYTSADMLSLENHTLIKAYQDGMLGNKIN